MLLWWLTLLAEAAMGLEIQTVRVPKYAKVGSSPFLVCDYSIQLEQRIYSVKWYKDNMEFYRFVPRDRPQKQVFRVQGAEVVVGSSNEQQVQLYKVTLQTSGTFMCEVSSEAPRFKTVEARADLTVIQPPSSPPSLREEFGGNIRGKRYRVGDMLAVNCSSPESSPPAKLRYFINNMMEDGSTTVGHRREGRGGLISPSLAIAFRLTREHFQGGVLRIRCEARIYNMWEESTEGIYPGESLGEKALERILAGGSTDIHSYIQRYLVLAVAILVQIFSATYRDISC